MFKNNPASLHAWNCKTKWGSEQS